MSQTFIFNHYFLKRSNDSALIILIRKYKVKEKEINKEINIDCENCPYFQALPPKEQILNESARKAARGGREILGIFDTLCGPCMEERKRQSSLEEKMEELLGVVKR